MVWMRRTNTSMLPEEMQSTTSITLRDGKPMVASIWPADPNPNTGTAAQRLRTLALVITAELVTPEGLPARTAIAKEIEKFRKQTTPGGR